MIVNRNSLLFLYINIISTFFPLVCVGLCPLSELYHKILYHKIAHSTVFCINLIDTIVNNYITVQQQWKILEITITMCLHCHAHCNCNCSSHVIRKTCYIWIVSKSPAFWSSNYQCCLFCCIFSSHEFLQKNFPTLLRLM